MPIVKGYRKSGGKYVKKHYRKAVTPKAVQTIVERTGVVSSKIDARLKNQSTSPVRRTQLEALQARVQKKCIDAFFKR